MDVIILGLNHYNTLGLVRSLGVVGHRVTLLVYQSKKLFVSKSKYIKRTIIIHEGDNLLAIIKNTASGMKEKPVILASDDGDAAFLNEQYQELIDYCYFESGRPDGSINRYRDKDIGNELAKKCGFTVPKNIVIKAPQEIDLYSLKYPILIKANNSIHGGKSAMMKCDTIRKAESFVNALPLNYFPIQIQEFIEKEYEIMLLGCSIYGGKRVFCPVANKKIRQYPKYIGLGSWSESVEVAGNKELEQLASHVTQYLREIEYTGNFSAEFLFYNDKYYFLEVNLRNDGTSWLSTCSGYNLPDLVCRSFVDSNVSIEGCIFNKMNYLNIFADFHNVIDGSIRFVDWVKQFNKHTCYSHYFKKDKRPFWYYLLFTLFSRIKNDN